MTPDASLHAALFWMAVGGAVVGAALYLVGEWMRASGIAHYFDSREGREAAEQRIRDLKPLDDEWKPVSWPRRTR